jgi:hypothetical protein
MAPGVKHSYSSRFRMIWVKFEYYWVELFVYLFVFFFWIFEIECWAICYRRSWIENQCLDGANQSQITKCIMGIEFCQLFGRNGLMKWILCVHWVVCGWGDPSGRVCVEVLALRWCILILCEIFRYFSSAYVLGLEFWSDFLPYSGAFMFILLPVVVYRMRLRVLRTYEVHTCVFLGSNIDQ